MNPEEIDRLHELVTAHKRRLHQLELQAATLGLNCPPGILIEIEDIKANIAMFDQQIGPDNIGSYREGSEVLRHYKNEIDDVSDNVQRLMVKEKRVYRLLGIPIFSVATSRKIILFLIIGFVILSILTAIDAASSQILPGEPLYSWKRTKEDIALTFTTDPDQRSKLHVDYAGRRLEEFNRLVVEGKTTNPVLVADTLNNLIDNVQGALNEDKQGTSLDVMPEVKQLLSQTERALTQAGTSDPAIQPVISNAQVKVSAIEQQIP